VERAWPIAAGSIGVAVAVVLMKGAAWWFTGSIAFYSDALESLVNVASAIMALVALWVAAMPADANHPYGHDKAEFFAAVIEGGLIVAAALSIFREAWFTWRHPVPFEAPLAGIGLNAAATLLNGGWAAVLLRAGRAARSAALVADARHLLTDVVTSVGVIVGVALAVASGIREIDPAVAAAVAVYILWAGFRLIGASVGGLMDTAPNPVVMERIRSVVAEQAAGALEAHDLRTRNAGRLTFLEFHLVVPGSMTVDQAHDICDRIEAALRREVPGLVTTIHVEPEGKAKHRGIVVL
jgi:cation diffusion facilitator family transporter